MKFLDFLFSRGNELIFVGLALLCLWKGEYPIGMTCAVASLVMGNRRIIQEKRKDS